MGPFAKSPCTSMSTTTTIPPAAIAAKAPAPVARRQKRAPMIGTNRAPLNRSQAPARHTTRPSGQGPSAGCASPEKGSDDRHQKGTAQQIVGHRKPPHDVLHQKSYHKNDHAHQQRQGAG